MAARWAIGIDLGTTHCAMARVALDGEGPSEVVEVAQLVRASELGTQPLLPSFLYAPPEAELPLGLPWDDGRRFAIGAYARDRAVEVPARVISSAKSWLCHAGVDRRSGLLPLGAPEDVEPISPVEASWRYLEHLSEAYDARFGAEGKLCEQEVVITVPASFDAAARELTVEAALAAGIEQLTLLEEPQAALYAWLEAHGEGWRSLLRPGDLVLVVDVGGGTSDFSAIAVREQGGSLELERIAVGDHILLGGDNMDLALAHHLKGRLETGGAELERRELASLTHACRAAKERLLSERSKKTLPIALAGRGSKLVGGTRRTDLSRDELERVLCDGFFPEVGADARPIARPRSALREVGLPYAQDAAVTRHLAAFLGRSVTPEMGATGMQPTALLFNGGVMKSAVLRERLHGVIGSWVGGALRLLDGADLDLAVARGAAVYGRVRHGRGIRIRGGTARAYYVGIESAVPAVPGVEPPLVAMCVAPFGMEEGTRAELGPHELAVLVGEKVRFRFFGSTTRRQDRAGAVLARWQGELEELAPIEVALPAEGRAEGEVVPVRLEASVTEVGTLLIEAVPLAPKSDDERWKVELSVRSG